MIAFRWLGGILIVALLAIAGLTAGDTETRVALVIGNGNYQYVAPLANPRNDAEAVTAKLSELGFAVTAAVDYDLAATREAIADFQRQSTGADVALVFYAGHGLQVAGENYLLPVDSRVEKAQDLASVSLRMSELYAALAAAQPGVAVLILDACRDNPFVDAVAGAPGLASGTVMQAGQGDGDNSAGILIAFAAAPGAVASDGSDGHSPFTTALLQWIDRPGIEIATMFRRVGQTVVDLTDGAQRPWVEASLLHDVYLNPGDPVAIAQAEGEPFGKALLTTIRQIQNPTERRAAFAFYDRLVPGSEDPEVDEMRSTNAALDSSDEFMQHSLIWLSIKDSEDPAIFQAFLDRFPQSAFVDLAQLRLAALGGSPVADVPPAIGEPAQPAAPGGPADALAAGSTPQIAAASSGTGAAPTPGGLVIYNSAQDEALAVPLDAPQSPSDTEAALGLGRDHLVALQRLLAQLGYLDGTPDGVIGQMSRTAIADFQAAAGLPATGFLDAAALRALVQQAAGPILASGIAGADRTGVQALAAVALRGPGAEPTVIRVESIDRHPPLQAYLRQLADKFEASHPGVAIEMHSQPDSEYKRNLLVMLGAENPPDIFYTWGGGHLRSVSEAGFVRDLTQEMAAGWAMQFKPGALENLTVDDRIFAVPMHMTLVSLWASRPLLQEVGIDVGSLGTWQGLLDAMATLKRAGITPIAVGGADRWPVQFYWGSLAESVGGRAVFEQALAGDGAGFTDPAFVRAGALLQQLAQTDPFQPGFGDATDTEALDTFSRGDAAMILAGSWALPRMTRMWPGGRGQGVENIVRVDFPPQDLAASPALTYGGIPAWVVRRDAPDEAVEFLRLLSSLETQTTSAAMGYDIPTLAGADSYIQDPLLRDVASQLTNSMYHQLFYDQALGPQAGEVVNDVAVALVEGDLSPEQAAAEVEAAWRRVRQPAGPETLQPEPAPAQ